MNRNTGIGPFTVCEASIMLGDIAPGGEDIQGVPAVAVFDALGEIFCIVDPEDCVGGDLKAAKARATRIAESLNQTEPK